MPRTVSVLYRSPERLVDELFHLGDLRGIGLRELLNRSRQP